MSHHTTQSTLGSPPNSPTRFRGTVGASAAPMLVDPNTLLDSFASAPTTRSAAGSTSGVTAPSVDPIEFLNRHFTTEDVLVAQLPAMREAVSDRMGRLDDRISNALQRQSETAEATRRHVQEAKSSVAALENRIRMVQAKASQSEKAVLEITKDMKRLDCAKRHLQRTITTLKRLHMLIHAVEQLRLACLRQPFPDYKSASHLVDATRLLLQHFESYTHKVEPMRLLSQNVADLQEDLRARLVRGFRVTAFGAQKALELEGRTQPVDENGTQEAVMTPDVLAGGALMIDSIGMEARKDFINDFCEDHLAWYVGKFQPPNKPKVVQRKSSFKIQENPDADKEQTAASLDQVERRFEWFGKMLKELDKKFPDVFPPYWNLQHALTRHFLIITRDHILILLNGPVKDKDASNATILMKAFQKTIVFEREVCQILQDDYGIIFKDKDGPEPNAVSLHRKAADGEEPRAKAAADMIAADMGVEEGRATVVQEPVEHLYGVASGAFEDYLSPYISLEEQSMDELLVEALEDGTVDTRGELPVFTTSTSLFVYIKGSITRCTALTKGKPFYMLYQAFQGSLRKYAQVLSSKLPSPTPTSTVVGGLSIAGVSSSFAKQDTSSVTKDIYKVPKGDEVKICHVISTCEYCADTVEALEDLIRDTIDDKYKDNIDMTGPQDAFHDLTAKAIRVLVSGLESRVDAGLKMMSTGNWGTFTDVGEESTYVRLIHEEIQPYVASCRGVIPTSYFRSFCDKFATAFTSTYYDMLLRQKRINEPGAQQLLLDVYNLKTLLLKIPVMEKQTSLNSPSRKSVPSGSTIAPAMYTKMVNKQFKRIETLLKLVGTPADLLLDVFKVQWVGGSALDLQGVMTLKGMKRTDQAAMLEKFGVDPATALKGATMGVSGATIVSEHVQAALQYKGSDVASRVNSDLNQMRQKVDDFRKSFR